MRQRELAITLDAALHVDHDEKLRAPIWQAKGRRRSFAPVRRRSGLKGRCEGVFWHPVRKADVRLILRAADRMELTGRLSGKRKGPIGHVGIEVLRELARLVNYSTGQLDPCYATIAARIRRSHSAVADALKALKHAGLLDWMRRYEDDPSQAGRRGPQIKQVSNAYRFMMPAGIARIVGHWAMPSPLPPDEEDRKRDHRLQRERWEFEESPIFTALEKLRAKLGFELA